MAYNLVSAAESYFTQNVIDNLSAGLGETSANVKKALSGIIPAEIIGLADKSSTTDGAQQILKTSEDVYSSGLLSNTTAYFQPQSLEQAMVVGGGFVNSLFGGSGLTNTITNLISNFSGVVPMNVSGLMSIALPIISALVGQQAKENNFSVTDLQSFLQTQKGNAQAAMPAGLNLSNNLSTSSSTSSSSSTATPSSTTAAATATASTAAPTTSTSTTSGSSSHTSKSDQAYINSIDPDDDPEDSENQLNVSNTSGSAGAKWLIPLLVVALLAVGAYYIFKDGCNKNKATQADTHGATTDTSKTNAGKDSTGREQTEITLVDGVKIKAYKGGVEDSLIQFINSDYYKNATDDQLKNRWFDFDNITFEFGKSTLTPGSSTQLDNVAAILKAYPKVNIKIGAYTDKKGDDADNLKLSQARANEVRKQLDKRGVGSQVVGDEGYGSKFATVPADASDSARQKDRRTALRLVK